VWAGVDSAWEQGKLEARKMPENAADSHTSGAPRTWAGAHSQRKEPGRRRIPQYTSAQTILQAV